MGVSGFRVDMAHLIPMEYWRWQLHRCRQRNPQVYFMAEAYGNDPAKLTEGNVLDALFKEFYDTILPGEVSGVQNTLGLLKGNPVTTWNSNRSLETRKTSNG